MLENRWKILDPNYPEDLPWDGQEIYIAVVKGLVDGKPSNKAYSGKVSITIFGGLKWLQELESNIVKSYGQCAHIIWQRKPPVPKLPKQWRIVGPTRCEKHTCECYDNSYCLGGPENCPNGIKTREFSYE